MTAEQEARDLLERIYIKGQHPQSYSSGEIVELANLIRDKKHAESKLQALKEEVEGLKSYPMVYDSYSGEAQMVDKAAVMEIITNLEDK